MKKRGEITLWFLIELGAAFFVGILLAGLAWNLSSGTIFEKLNVAKDLGIQINALEGLPGNAYIVNDNLHGYSVRITGNKIEVFDAPSEINKGIYHFVSSKGKNFDFETENSAASKKSIVISKIDGDIIISEKIPEEFS